MGTSPTDPRVLLVDDDELVRRAGARSLRTRLGADVTEAMGAMHALSLWRREPEAFDVVVIDLDMPEMDGVQLIRRFERLAPDLPVIVWSGRSLEPVPTELESARALVPKAAGIASLVDAVGDAVGRGRRRSGMRTRASIARHRGDEETVQETTKKLVGD